MGGARYWRISDAATVVARRRHVFDKRNRTARAIVQAGMPRCQATLRNERRRSCRYARAIRRRGNRVRAYNHSDEQQSSSWPRNLNGARLRVARLGLAPPSTIERLMGVLGSAARTRSRFIVTYRKPCGEQFGGKPISCGSSFTASARWNQIRDHPATCLLSRSSSLHAGGRPGVRSMTCHRLPATQTPLSSRKRPQRVHQRIGYSAPFSVTGAHA